MGLPAIDFHSAVDTEQLYFLCRINVKEINKNTCSEALDSITIMTTMEARRPVLVRGVTSKLEKVIASRCDMGIAHYDVSPSLTLSVFCDVMRQQPLLDLPTGRCTIHLCLSSLSLPYYKTKTSPLHPIHLYPTPLILQFLIPLLFAFTKTRNYVLIKFTQSSQQITHV